MKFVVTFVMNTARYCVHTEGCSAAFTGKTKNLIPDTFDSIDSAVKWANEDESQKAGEPTKAILTICACAHKRK
jgi:hypothetical protein